MFLKKISLKNFRNYDVLDFEFKKNKTLFTGKNAQGKTNLLEAVYYLSSLDSNRIKKDIELVKFNSDFSSISAVVDKDNVEIDLDILINPHKNKILKVNGIKKNKHKDFIRVLSVVNFAASDLMLLRGEPNDRRKWLDLAICQIYPQYLDKLSKYNKIRLQKANYLNNFNIKDDMLDVFNSQLAIASSNIVYLRMKFIEEIKKIALDKHKNISRNEEINIKYESDIIKEIIPLSDMTEIFSNALNENKQKEIMRQTCLIGPHRDDICFEINNLDARRYASQGQQRTLVLALKLSELDIISDKTGDNPVLLLDDVLAELDDIRQNYLLNSIKPDVQTIITSVDTLFFDEKFLYDVDIININGGKIVK